MLARDEGASGPQIAAAVSWAPHTVRGFLAGVAKKGIKVEALERIRGSARTNRAPRVAIPSIGWSRRLKSKTIRRQQGHPEARSEHT
jgi:hypothetical protein